MKLYHGTTEEIARKAISEGLLPKSITGVGGNWDHTIAAADDRIYLTAGYAPYFASCATSEDLDRTGDKWGIVEIETDKVFYHPVETMRAIFLPDEDFMEQMTRSMTKEEVGAINPEMNGDSEAAYMLSAFEGFPWDGDYLVKTAWYRDNITRFAHMWHASVEGLGNCSVIGGIHPSAITRVSIYDPHSNPTMTISAMDPMISTMNWKICEAKYKELTRWFMGYEVSANKMFRYGQYEELDEEDLHEARIKSMQKALEEFAEDSPERKQLEEQIGFFAQEVERTKAWEEEVIPNRSGIELIQPAQFGTGDCAPSMLTKEVIIQKVMHSAMTGDGSAPGLIPQLPPGPRRHPLSTSRAYEDGELSAEEISLMNQEQSDGGTNLGWYSKYIASITKDWMVDEYPAADDEQIEKLTAHFLEHMTKFLENAWDTEIAKVTGKKMSR